MCISPGLKTSPLSSNFQGHHLTGKTALARASVVMLLYRATLSTLSYIPLQSPFAPEGQNCSS